ncbi:MAG TPA: glucoamylase family protein [Gemmataceae bacterium]|nr:glucoamylase family protein [Gemmataceae bacterium]
MNHSETPIEGRAFPGGVARITAAEQAFLLSLQRQALTYFLDNQSAGGLMRDRQANRAPHRMLGWCSTAATGMGLIALALAAAPPYRLLERDMAVHRVRLALNAALERVPHDHGIMPHFLDSHTDELRGHDAYSTVDSSWLLAGALWAAEFLKDPALEELAQHLYQRVDWYYWTDPHSSDSGLLRHGKGCDGRFLPYYWDHFNGETVAMYVMSAGATVDRAVPPKAMAALKPFYGTVAGLRFNNADLGLFTFEYGLDLLDLRCWRSPGADLAAEASIATRANYLFCKQQAEHFLTYRYFWGLSNGDGPDDPPQRDSYRARSPHLPIDGTAQLTDTLAAVAHAPAEVLENLERAEHDHVLRARGRYGFSPVNLDRHWVGQDMVGIDAGAAVLALDNYLMNNRVRRVFHALPCVHHGLQRLGFIGVEKVAPPLTVEDDPL